MAENMKRKMKIAFINIYSGTVNRGAETFIHELALRLNEKYQVTLFQDGPKKGFEDYEVVRVNASIDWKRKDTSGTLLARLFADYWQRKIAMFTLNCLPVIWREKYDIVVPVNGGWQASFIRLVTWLYGGKLIISGQSGMGWDDRNNLWNFPDVFVALSSKALIWSKKTNPFIRTEYIPNGVDLKRFNPCGPKIETGLKRPIILCVAALIQSKRVDLVIKAVSRLKKVSLLVVGDGDLKNEIQELGEKMLKSRFKIMAVPYGQMPDIYRAADLFTLVSESYYSFEIVLLEAMASNLAVVANKDEIRENIVGDAGFLVDPSDLDNYSKMLFKALGKKWGSIPREQSKRFSWDNISEQYDKLIRNLLS